MAVTEAVLELVARARRERPADLKAGGLDLGHALEASLYFTCVHDAGLLRLFHDPQDVRAVAGLESPMARLIAENGFARGAALRAVRRRASSHRLLQRIKRAIPRRSRAVSKFDEARPPILFLARSVRFARFLRPVADALGPDCGFLVPDRDAELLAIVRSWNFPCHAYPAGMRPQRQMGTLIADYAPHWAGMAELFEGMIGRLSPRLVVVPEGNAPDDEVLARVAERLGVASACIQQGWSPILHPGFHNLRYDAMLIWGEGFGELLATANPRQKFLVAGNFHLARRPTAPGAGVLFLFQGFDNWMGGRKSADDMLDLAEAVATALPDQQVFIRPHPVVPLPEVVRDRLARHPNIRIESAHDVPLTDAFARAKISVSVYSSTILESIAAGVVPLVFNTAGLPRYWPDIEAAGAGLETQTLEAALGAIIRLSQERAALEAYQEPMRGFTERFFRFRGEAAIVQSTTALRQLAGLA